ncbi:MAG: type I pullulanase [Oscillospiraceae bacterium]|nr:type I pullulanase [Oscillospiraceae bacterium]
MNYKDYSTEKFEAEYTYTGGDLGANWSPEKTFFRLWAPTAEKAVLRLYKSGDINCSDLLEEMIMAADEKGTWIAEKYGDLNGIYYTFCVTAKGEEKEAADPYAKAAGVNGNRSMVIDLASTNPEGWEQDNGVFFGQRVTDAVLYEMHVRDISSDISSGINNKGKFLGLTEEGTITAFGASTGIDHIKELGVTHVHLLPSYDYGSVDESKPDSNQYNWGYDPVNYNVPEGSYSTDAKNGAVRIREMKEMIKAFHKKDIGVILDVVYNHVYHTDEFCFNVLVPGYFSRRDENGNYSAGSGCGNDTATERSMVRKYIVDSVKYWADEYHLDGFRFDISGLLDVVTINEVIVEVHKSHPNVIIYMEGWDVPTAVTKPGVELAHMYNSEKMPGAAFFSDTFRNAIRGKDDGLQKGFAAGGKVDKSVLDQCFMGMPAWCKTPVQSINYNSCHDGYTLFDKIALSAPNADFSERVRMNKLAAAFCLLSQGVPFFQAGEEMLRSKKHPNGSFEHNSYNCPDSVNSIRWNDLIDPEYRKTFEYYKGLIRFRKGHRALRMQNAADVYTHITVMGGLEEGVAAYHIWGNVNCESAEAIYVIFNSTGEEKEINLPVGKWKVCIDGETAGTETLYIAEDKITVPPISAVVMIK